MKRRTYPSASTPYATRALRSLAALLIPAGLLAGCSGDESLLVAPTPDPPDDGPLPVSRALATIENPTPPPAAVFAMQCLGPGEVAACGDAGFAAVDRNGTWQVLPTGVPVRLNAAWGTSADNVWFAGDDGCFLHWDGSALTPIDLGGSDWIGLWGDAATGEVWLLSTSSVVRWNGTSSSRDTYPTLPKPYAYYGIGGTAPDDVYVVGSAGSVAHWDGSAWSDIPTGLGTGTLRSVVALGSEVFIGTSDSELWHFDGTAWSSFDESSNRSFNVVCGRAADNVYAFGDGGLMLRWNGAAWIDIFDATFFDTSYSINAACVTPNGGLAVGGSSTGTVTNLSRYGNGSWSQMGGSVLPEQELNDIWVFDRDHAIAVGGSGTIVQRDAAGWAEVPHGLTTNGLLGVWASSPGDIWAVGVAGTVLNGDGSTWALVDTGPDDLLLSSVGGDGPDNVWIVGARALLHWNGITWANRWAELPDTLASYARVQVVAGGDVFLAGSDLMHWDGSAWHRTSIKSASSAYLFDVWASSAQDVWMTSDAGVFHWDGINLTDRWRTDPANALWAVTGTGRGDVLLGGTGDLLQLAGGLPALIPIPARGIYAAGTGSDGVSYLIGARGLVVRVE